ncbi:MAG: ATP-binding cassette domain-containing protein [candidate division Zixibacteria bacterium]|nr:ATP-binding cassette domain-containing protein [candidate division Zixibacteria bacterium]
MDDEIVANLQNVYLGAEKTKSIFRNFNLTLKTGRTSIVTGGPGSGKTSLAALLTGLEFADEGLVEVFGESLRPRRTMAVNRVRRMIGGVGGIFGLIPSMTVAENISFPLVISGVSKRRRKTKLLKMLTEFSLLKKAGNYTHTLTRVERTLVQLARASISNQPLFIIDEPSAGLDKSTTAHVFEFLTKASLSGRSLLLLCSDIPTHDLPNSDIYHISNGVLE